MSHIKPGDLVMVVRPKRCGCHKGLGKIFTVAALATDNRYGKCTECGARTYPPFTPTAQIRNGFAELTRLKKIEHLNEADELADAMRELEMAQAQVAKAKREVRREMEALGRPKRMRR